MGDTPRRRDWSEALGLIHIVPTLGYVAITGGHLGGFNGWRRTGTAEIVLGSCVGTCASPTVSASRGGLTIGYKGCGAGHDFSRTKGCVPASHP